MKAFVKTAALLGVVLGGEEPQNGGGHVDQGVLGGVELRNRCDQEGMIALTFDGGPGQATGLLLNKLNEKNVVATFHLSTAHLNQDLIETFARAQRENGHTIGLYWNPTQRIADMTDEEIIAALMEESEAVFRAVRVHPRYIRLPHNSVDQRLLDILTGMSFIPTEHNFDPQDYIDSTVDGLRNKYEETFSRYTPPFQGRFISLHHDTTPIDKSDAIGAVIDLAREDRFGYRFVGLDDCLGQAFPYKSDAAGRGRLLSKAGIVPSESNPDYEDDNAENDESENPVVVPHSTDSSTRVHPVIAAIFAPALAWLL